MLSGYLHRKGTADMQPIAFRLPLLDIPMCWYVIIIVVCILISAYVVTF
jgi:hypothetical protein